MVKRKYVAYKGMSGSKKPRVSAPPANRGFYGPVYRVKKAYFGFLERKFVDVAQAQYNCDTTGSVTLLNGAAQGDDYNNRIGRKTTNVAVQLRGILQPVDASVEFNLSRVMIVYDKQANGAAPAVTDILTAATATAHANLNNRTRFKILCDKQYATGSYDTTTGYAASITCKNVNLYKKINLPTIWSGTGATAGSIVNGAIYLVTIGTNAAGTGATLKTTTRIRFIDA